VAQHETDGMIGIGGRWWRFPGAKIDTGLWEGELGSHEAMLLHDGDGAVIEGVELSEAEIEQMSREMLLADLLELAVGKLRTGKGWDEGTTGDVFREILNVYPDHGKKAIGLAMESGTLGNPGTAHTTP